jgi:hypothetical protein
MRKLAVAASWIALAVLIGAPVFFFLSRMQLDAMKGWMLAATAVWFLTTPLWMERR